VRSTAPAASSLSTTGMFSRRGRDAFERAGGALQPAYAQTKRHRSSVSFRWTWSPAFGRHPLTDHTDLNGVAVFAQACRMGLEGIVSKRLGAPYRSGQSRDWLKIKNPDSPAMLRAREGSDRWR
jgi:hypothetical protein